MLDATASVLIGENDRARFAQLAEILESEFNARCANAETFDQLQALLLERRWSLVLIGERLPYSHSHRDVLLSNYFITLNTKSLGLRAGLILKSDVEPDLAGVIPTPLFIYLGEHDSDAGREVTVTQLAVVIKRVPRPPTLTFEEGQGLGRSVRSVGDGREFELGKHRLSRLVSFMFDCDSAAVSALRPGFSGALVFRVRPVRNAGSVGTFVPKLVPHDDVWKLAREIKQHLAATETLSKPPYLAHLPQIISPRLPAEPEHAELRKAVRYGNWWAVAYDFLGADLGNLIDLATALKAPAPVLAATVAGSKFGERFSSDAASLRFEIVKASVDWLCENWYTNPRLIRRESRRVWTGRSLPDREFVDVPPYGLNARNKASALSFLEGPARELGQRTCRGWTECSKLVSAFLENEAADTGIACLDRELQFILAPGHGDLNANNIWLWLDQPFHPFLIDLPFYEPKTHALLDLARLEVELKFVIMDSELDSSPTALPALDQTWSQLSAWQAMDEFLLSVDVPETPTWPDGAYIENVERIFKLIRWIRSRAATVQTQRMTNGVIPSFREEYYPALLYQTLGPIAYTSLPIFKRLLAVYSAASIIKSLQSVSPCD